MGRLPLVSILSVIALCVCAFDPAAEGGPARAPHAVRTPSMPVCAMRANDTPERLDACIQAGSLWKHLAQFQRIANENKGPDGHGYRDTGTPGYEASVDYVAGLMQQAGYRVAIQQYTYSAEVTDDSARFDTSNRAFAIDRDWYAARGSGAGSVTARVEPATGTGCSMADFAGFPHGRIALIAGGSCAPAMQVRNAERADASAVVIYAPEGGAYAMRLSARATIPVIGAASREIGEELLREYRSGRAPIAHIEIRLKKQSGLDYNLIADSPLGDPSHLVVIDAHLDSIFGAGMLDNASGSASILETALALAKTPTHNRLRYIWFGGEELGLLGSQYYTTHLAPQERKRIVFDVDVDVTATPNFDIQIADPANASDVGLFPKNVVPQSKVGNDAFYDVFAAGGVISRAAPFGNDGTDSNSFALAGIPDTGVLTEQDCCKQQWEIRLWGGFPGNYEGNVPSFDGGCADQPERWCDNLSNNDPFVFELVSKAVARVTLSLANDPKLGSVDSR